MIRVLTFILLIGKILTPSTVVADEFEFLECSYTYYTHMHGDSELPIVTNYKQRGIIRNNISKFLDNATYYLEGMLTRPPSKGDYMTFKEGDGKYAIIFVDKDGDLILGYEYGDITRHYLGSESLLTGEFSSGTGKYKGIHGKYERIKYSGNVNKIKADLKGHLKEVPPLSHRGGYDHSMCNIMKGKFGIK